MSFGQQLRILAEDNATRRTDLGTCRDPALLDPMPAQLAFDDFRQRLGPLEFRDPERARHLAVAAAYAEVRIVADDAVLTFLQRPEHACRRAARIEAVHALAFDERIGPARGISVHLDDVLRSFVQIDWRLPQAIRKASVGGDVVGLIARDHASLAA